MGRGNGASRSAESGAAALEMALVLPLLIVLVFGMLFGGILVFRDITISDAAREATRFGATLGTDPAVSSTTDDWRESVYNRAVNSSYGQLDPSVSGQDVCVALFRDGTWYSKDAPGAGNGHGNDECFSDSRAGEERVQVLITRDDELNAVLYQYSVTLTGRGIALYEVGEATTP